MNWFKKKQPALRDISTSFHPVADYHPSGAMASQKYHEDLLQNKKRFFRSCSSENNTGGMIVFPVSTSSSLEADIRAWLEFFAAGNWNIGRGFGGHYATNGGEFGDASITVDLWNVSWQEVLQVVENLQKNYCPYPVLIKNFAMGAIWLALYTK